MSTPATIARHAPGAPRWAVFGAMTFVAIFLVLSFHHGRHLPWNLVRLAPSVALAHGATIYPPETSGVITGHIYTPLGALAFAPVAWLPDLSWMATAASFLAAVYFTAPLLLLARFATREHGIASIEAAGVLLAALLLAALDTTLRYPLVLVHADAPAVALAGLALIAAARCMGENGARNAFWSGALAVAAILCKQPLVLTWLTLAVGVMLLGGRRSALRYFAGSAIVGAIALACIAAFGDWRAFFFNCLQVPAHHPWNTPGFEFVWGAVAPAQDIPTRMRAVATAFVLVAQQWWPAFAIAAGCIVRAVTAPTCLASPLVRTALLAAITAGVQAPLAFAALLKVGGDLNALAPMLMPLLLMLVALAFHLPSVAPATAMPLVRPAVAVLLVTLAACNLPRLVFLLQAAAQPDPHRAMVAYLRAHPGEVYLPWNPLHTLVAENRRDHFDYGVFDRALAGRPLTPEHYRRHLPPRMRHVAIRRDQVAGGFQSFRHYLGAMREVASPAELQDWIFYELAPGPAAAPAGSKE